MKDSNFKVCVRCFTFNQSKYIIETMNGFCNQQTNFPFICCVVDDASTDGEQEVITDYLNEYFDMHNSSVAYKKETDYAHIFYSQHKENKNCYFVVLFLKENHYKKKSKLPYIEKWRRNCKYEAICEGDDFWCTNTKLQSEVNYLDNDAEIGLVYTNFHYIDEIGNKIDAPNVEPYISLPKYIREGYIWHYLLNGECGVLTCTILFRHRLLQDERIFIDQSIFLTIARQSKFAYIDEKSSCYRILPNSAMRSSVSWVQRASANAKFYQLYYFSKGFPTNKFYFSFKSKLHVARYFIRLIKSWSLIDEVDKKTMLKNIVKNNLLLILYLPISMVIIILCKFKRRK